MMQMKKRTLITYILSLLAFHVGLVAFDTEFIPKYYMYKNILIIVLAVVLMPYIKIFLKKKYLLINIILIIFIGINFYSSYINMNYQSSSLITSLRFAMQITEFFLVCEYLHYYDEASHAINVFFGCSIFYCILSDVLMVVDPHVKTLVWGDTWTTYLVGNKFPLVYLHFACIIFYYARSKDKGFSKKKIRQSMFVLWICTMFISIITQCASGILTTLVLAIMFQKKDIVAKIKNRPWLMLMGIFILDSLLLAFNGILQIPPIKYVIVNVLHRSADLTGRLGIFAGIAEILVINPWYGVGYENNATLCKRFVGAENAQNGLLDCVVSWGIIGLIIICALIFVAISLGKEKQNEGFAIYIIIMILLSMVEITFRSSFFCMLAIYAFYRNNNDLRAINHSN